MNVCTDLIETCKLVKSWNQHHIIRNQPGVMQHSSFLEASQQGRAVCSTFASIYLHLTFFIREQQGMCMHLNPSISEPTTLNASSLLRSSQHHNPTTSRASYKRTCTMAQSCPLTCLSYLSFADLRSQREMLLIKFLLFGTVAAGCIKISFQQRWVQMRTVHL
jgi:hypothetical protein